MHTPTKHRPIHLDHPGGTVQLVQLTDCHLGHAPGSKLLGMDTDHSLQAVIDLVKRERKQTDLVLGTGDLSDHGANAAYGRLYQYFSQVCTSSFWLPGNHDSWHDMAADSGPNCQLSNEVRIANWQILMLDSQIPGEIGGELGVDQLALLDDCLQRADAEGLHTLICLHHHPIAIGSDWLDQQMVADAEEFFTVVGRHSSVRAILWGHIHQQIDSERDGIALLATPSTCVQFAPGLAKFKDDDLPPGYRWLDLEPDGTINTAVSRVQGVSFTVELDSGGYL
ncbi:MAG: 3',5'-cyclic-AMP phosphodiesterase [Gammaproteobacteria bacterium]|nr:MAG: 3',5'-cyclic-AMP phosphodiesterase [Gammaproteobacteria bacterium]